MSQALNTNRSAKDFFFPQTENLADETFFSSMKDGAIFVNTSRGELVDEAALIHALNRLSEAGKLRAGLPPVCIGQGFQGRSGEIGIGKCTSCFAKSLHGCPPKAIDIVKFLEENWTQAPDKEIKNS